MKSSSSFSDSGVWQGLATFASILATLGVNSLSNFYPPGGLNVGQIANTLFKEVQIIPANYAFAIWGVIYVGLIAYGIYQLQPAQRKDWSIRHVNRYLILACLAQVAWIYLFTLRWFWFSVVAMLIILGSLLLAYQSLGVGQVRTTRRRQWLAHIPFSLYLAWISVATIVNVASALFNSGLQQYGTVWTVLMLLIGGVLAALVTLWRTDVAFVLVFVWAYVAIAIRQQTNPAISFTAVGVAIALIVHLILSRRMSNQY